MATPLLTVDLLTVPAVGVTPNLTNLSGGLSHLNGSNGGDWDFSRNAPHGNGSKLLGNEQLIPTPWADAPSALPYFQNAPGFRYFEVDGRDILGFDGENDSPIQTILGTGPGGESGAYLSGPGQLNSGIDYFFEASQNTRRFVWMGGVGGGNYSVTVSFLDGSLPNQSVILVDSQANFTNERWFAVKFCSQFPTTCKVRIRRVTATASDYYGYLCIAACYLEADILPPNYYGFKRYMAYMQSFGNY